MSRRDDTAAAKPTVTTTEARQGVTGHNVRYVLAISLGVAVLVVGLLWAWYAYTTPT